MTDFDRLLIYHSLRPDRLTMAMSKFVSATLGKEYIVSKPFDLERSFQECHIIYVLDIYIYITKS